jgi:hypothetical protein
MVPIMFPTVPALPVTSGSNRHRFETATHENPCVACHYGQELNALGLPFEGFDAIGRFRTSDNYGFPVDVSGLAVRDPAGSDITFNGPIELAKILTDHDTVQRCFGRYWLMYALDRAVRSTEERDLDAIQTAFKSSGLDLRALIAAVITTDAFLAPPEPADAGSGDANDGSISIPSDSDAFPEGCATASQIFASHGCTTLCHRPAASASVGGFDMVTPGWEHRLVGAGPLASAPDTSLCKNEGLVYLNKTQPATGLFLDKLKPNPPCGLRMPSASPPLAATEIDCIQKWANNIVAGGPGQ